MLTVGCAVREGARGKDARAELERQWGIRVEAVRMSAGGYMIDFRYRVVDPEKAKPLLSRESKATLVDHATGTVLFVPTAPKVGSLRQTSRQPLAGRTYFILFSNLSRTVKPGSGVDVVIGDFRAENLVVE